MHSVFNHLLAALCIADLLFIGGNLALTPIALGKPEVFNPGKSTQMHENTSSSSKNRATLFVLAKIPLFGFCKFPIFNIGQTLIEDLRMQRIDCESSPRALYQLKLADKLYKKLFLKHASAMVT